MNRILVGYDGSVSAQGAYAFALTLTAKFGAVLDVLAVARPPEPADDVETEAEIERAQEHFARDFNALREQASALGIVPHCEVAVGHPAIQLVRYAEAHGIDHIVVGHRGHTLFERFLIGSVARQVIAYAHCAVTVVRVPLNG